ncbi:MAG: FliM/FliN family flagellar motor switch protein [Pseudomonadota bacterium]
MSAKANSRISAEAPQSAQQVKLQEITDGVAGRNLYDGNLSLIQNLRVRLEVRAGSCEMSVGELYALKENSILRLDRLTNEPLDIYLDGKAVARGNLVVVDDNFGICITEISDPGKP